MRSKWVGAVGLTVVAGGLFAARALRARSDDCCDKSAHAQTAGASSVLQPWEPVDQSFLGCQQSCGLGRGVHRADAVPQPGAREGDYAYCPVSGAVFQVSGKTPHREAGGKPLYFCCDACAAYFSAHEEEVLRKRGVGSQG
jgi:YHS domain-containing protein